VAASNPFCSCDRIFAARGQHRTDQRARRPAHRRPVGLSSRKCDAEPRSYSAPPNFLAVRASQLGVQDAMLLFLTVFTSSSPLADFVAQFPWGAFLKKGLALRRGKPFLRRYMLKIHLSFPRFILSANWRPVFIYFCGLLFRSSRCDLCIPAVSTSGAGSLELSASSFGVALDPASTPADLAGRPISSAHPNKARERQ